MDKRLFALLMIVRLKQTRMQRADRPEGGNNDVDFVKKTEKLVYVPCIPTTYVLYYARFIPPIKIQFDRL